MDGTRITERAANKNLTRKLSMSIILSDPEEYSGGKLQFIDYMGKVQSVTKEREL